MSTIEIKVGPPPKFRTLARTRKFTAEVIEAARRMPPDSWFVVPGSDEFGAKGMSARRRVLELKLHDAKLTDRFVAILDESEGGGLVVRRVGDPISRPVARPGKATKL